MTKTNSRMISRNYAKILYIYNMINSMILILLRIKCSETSLTQTSVPPTVRISLGEYHYITYIIIIHLIIIVVKIQKQYIIFICLQ